MDPYTPLDRAPTAGRLRAPRAPRRALRTEGLAYRWDRLREDQRQHAWGMVAEAQHTGRQRVRLYATLIVLWLVVDVVLLTLVLHGVRL